jgi:hypothetical protein
MLIKEENAVEKDSEGYVDQVKTPLGNCNDLINEESILQYYGRLMGVTVNETPMCHCEMAGEGIQYSWVAAKTKWRRFPVSAKRRKRAFSKFGESMPVKRSGNNEIVLCLFTKTINLCLSCLA